MISIDKKSDECQTKKREQKGKRNCVWYGKIVDSAKECQRASQHINDSFNERQSYICCVTWTNRTNFINILYSKFICRVRFFFAHSASISCNVCVCESVPISRGHTSLYLRSFFLFIGSPEPTSTYKLRHITMFEVFRLFSLVSLSLSLDLLSVHMRVCVSVFLFSSAMSMWNEEPDITDDYWPQISSKHITILPSLILDLWIKLRTVEMKIMHFVVTGDIRQIVIYNFQLQLVISPLCGQWHHTHRYQR